MHDDSLPRTLTDREIDSVSGGDPGCVGEAVSGLATSLPPGVFGQAAANIARSGPGSIPEVIRAYCPT